MEPEVLGLENGWTSVLPVLLYRGALAGASADEAEGELAANGWRPDWRDGVYDYHHYHSTAHEALACTAGAATLTLGGKGGRRVEVVAGDLLVLPAGTGHCRVAADSDFLVVGAYPAGQSWDICREPPDAATRERIAAVPLPNADPLFGPDGPLARLWRG